MYKMRVRIQINYNDRPREIYTALFDNYDEVIIEIKKLGTLDSFSKIDDTGEFIPRKNVDSIYYEVLHTCRCELNYRRIYPNVDNTYIEQCIRCKKLFAITTNISTRKKEINRAGIEYMLAD